MTPDRYAAQARESDARIEQLEARLVRSEAALGRVRALVDKWHQIDAAKPYATDHVASLADDLSEALGPPLTSDEREALTAVFRAAISCVPGECDHEYDYECAMAWLAAPATGTIHLHTSDGE